MEKLELAVGTYVQFNHNGFRIGRVVKTQGKKITVVLSPFMLKGKRKGKKIRIDKEKISGIVYRKKVVEWQG
jgi:hypothetical protein